MRRGANTTNARSREKVQLTGTVERAELAVDKCKAKIRECIRWWGFGLGRPGAAWGGLGSPEVAWCGA